MHDAARQRANGFHLLGLAQLLFQPFAPRDIPKDQHHAMQGALAITYRGCTVGNAKFVAISGEQHGIVL